MSDIITSDSETTTWPSLNQVKPSVSDSDQWLRKINLTVFDTQSGSGLDLSNFRINFQVRKNTAQSPNLLNARIYNLAPKTMNKVIIFKRVSLSAGYRTGRYGEIYQGTVVQYMIGKENPVDTYIDIFAGDGDGALNYDIATKSWAAGTDKNTVLQYLVSTLQGRNQEISAGTIETGDYGKQKYIRSYAVMGMIRDRLRDHASASNSDLFIDNGKVNLLARTKYKPGEAAVLSPATGLVGLPVVTPQGIQARCLLNPNLVLGGLVKIETKFLSGIPYEPGSDGQPTGDRRSNAAIWQQQLTSAYTSPTGTYKILLLEHSGDTRGNPWYSDMVCVALDESGKIIFSGDLPYNRIPGNAYGDDGGGENFSGGGTEGGGFG